MAANKAARAGLALWSAAAAAFAAYGVLAKPMMLHAAALPLAGSLLGAAGLLLDAEPPALGLALLACASALLAGLWQARSRGAFAALIAGGFLWSMKRQEGRRRWLMALGAVLFLAGVGWKDSARWSALATMWLATPALMAEAAGLFAAAAAFGLWFFGSRTSVLVESPALAALGVMAGAVFHPGLRAADAAFAVAAIAAAWAISRPSS